MISHSFKIVAQVNDVPKHMNVHLQSLEWRAGKYFYLVKSYWESVLARKLAIG